MTPDRPLPKGIPDLAIGLGLAAFALAEALRVASPSRGTTEFTTLLVNALVVGWGMALAAGLHRRAPGLALLLVWLAGGYQIGFGVEILLVELAVAVVAFGTARWGSTAVVWASGLSIPVGAVLAMVFLRSYGWARGESAISALLNGFKVTGLTFTAGWLLVAMIGATILVVPWLVGLLLRIRSKAGETEAARQVAVREAEQAQEIARLREQQAGLARDVHDVVGHSLAVILAQAESAQFRAESDTEALKKSMRDIATSARSSLQDVRQVLSGTADATAPVTGGLGSLIDGVRASGHEVLDGLTGTPQPLPPELDVVSYRVLQEMLTNAIKHGRRGAPVTVVRHWPQQPGERDLRIQVSNPTDGPAHEAGQGLIGLQRRLDAVGGRLDVRREGELFTATAWVPVRPG